LEPVRECSKGEVLGGAAQRDKEVMVVRADHRTASQEVALDGD
jgi:hypothetical protein